MNKRKKNKRNRLVPVSSNRSVFTVWTGLLTLLLLGMGMMPLRLLWAQGQKLEGISLRYKGKSGETMRYRSWFRMRMVGTATRATAGSVPERRYEFDSESTHVQKVNSVDSEGTLELETQKESGKSRMVLNGREEPLPETPSHRIVKMTNRGKVVEEREVGEEGEEETKVSDLASPLYPARLLDEIFVEAVHNIVFPEKAVKVGDTWTDKPEVEISPGLKTTISLTSKLKEFVKVNGYRCAVIETEARAPVELKQAEGEMGVQLRGQFAAWVTLYFDYEKGIDVMSENWIRMVVGGSVTLPQIGAINVTAKVAANAKTVLVK